jgi:hypothetical protein
MLLLMLAAPAAQAQVRICASDLTNFDDTPTITVPAGVIFAAWGHAGGDLRQVRLDPNYPPARENGQTAFVTTQPVQLSASAACAVTDAKRLVSAQRAWHDQPVTAGDQMVYTAAGVRAPAGDVTREGQTLSVLMSMNILAATVTGPLAGTDTIP